MSQASGEQGRNNSKGRKHQQKGDLPARRRGTGPVRIAEASLHLATTVWKIMLALMQQVFLVAHISSWSSATPSALALGLAKKKSTSKKKAMMGVGSQHG